MKNVRLFVSSAVEASIILFVLSGSACDYHSPFDDPAWSGPAASLSVGVAEIEGVDLPLLFGNEAICLWGPDDPAAVGEDPGYDLHFEVAAPEPIIEYGGDEGEFDEDDAYLEYYDTPVYLPSSGAADFGEDETYGYYAVVTTGALDEFLLIGGMHRLFDSSGPRDMAAGSLLGWLDHADGATARLTIGLRRGDPAMSGSESLPTTFRARDVTWSTDAVSLRSDDFVCGADGHVYASLLGY